MTYHIFIGYDDRQHEPFLVAKHTLEKHAKVPIKVHKLYHKDLRLSGLFTREWTIDSTGQYICNVDGRPFSTQFSHSRFLVPELWRNLTDPNKNSLVMFVDCDYLWTDDIGIMFKEIEQQRLRSNKAHPLYCVKHDYKASKDVKMDNMVQVDYNRKLWSAMMVFDMDSEDNKYLTPELVNTETGRRLHNFCWVRDVKQIRNVPEEWQFIPNHSEKHTTQVKGLHYTEGGPWFPNYRNCRYSQIWWSEYNDYLKRKLLDVSFDIARMIDGD